MKQIFLVDSCHYSLIADIVSFADRLNDKQICIRSRNTSPIPSEQSKNNDTNDTGLGLYRYNAYNDASQGVIDFYIGKTNSAPYHIEINKNNIISATCTPFYRGKKYIGSFTIPSTITDGKNYTAVLVKKGVHFNERTNYTATTFVPKGETKTSAEIATDLANQFTNKAKFGNIELKAVADEDTVTISGFNVGEDFELKLGDALTGVGVTQTHAKPAIGGYKHLKQLISECRAGKGVNYDDNDLYPNTDSVSKDEKRVLFSIKFYTDRVYGKQRDEKVLQELILAVKEKESAAIMSVYHLLPWGVVTANIHPCGASVLYDGEPYDAELEPFLDDPNDV